MDVETLLERLLRFRTYYEASGGGVTISGGEPLLQAEALLELLRRLHEAGVHTCLDTAGGVAGDFSQLLCYTDLVLLDVKALDEESYHQLTGGDYAAPQAFLRQVQAAQRPLWLRYVVVPGLTDGQDQLEQLRIFAEGLSYVEQVELLPYHKMGVHKYESMGMNDPLEDTPAMDPEQCKILQKQFFAKWEKEGG